jgi:adenylate kinase family enzyme
VLGASDPLPAPARRIAVTGCSGSGKSTLGRALAELLGIPYTELDGLFHGPDWTPRPEFEADVAALASGPEWITEYGYTLARPLLGPRAELLVWLDLPRWRVMTQVVPRTVRRRLAREELWNGNLEPPLHTVLTDPDHIVRWAWRTHPKTGRRVHELARARPDLPIVRLRSRRDVRTWLAGPARALGSRASGT